MKYRLQLTAIVVLAATLSCAPESPAQKKEVRFLPCAVAESIEGDWEPCEAVQKILGKRNFDTEFPRYSFRKDEKVVETFSSKMRELLEKAKLESYVSGWVTRHNDKETDESVFVVTELKGNIFILFGPKKHDGTNGFFADRLVTIVNGETRDADLLFLAYRPGDIFAAFQRVKKKQ